jgi:hypothetical protein
MARCSCRTSGGTGTSSWTKPRCSGWSINENRWKTAAVFQVTLEDPMFFFSRLHLVPSVFSLYQISSETVGCIFFQVICQTPNITTNGLCKRSPNGILGFKKLGFHGFPTLLSS